MAKKQLSEEKLLYRQLGWELLGLALMSSASGDKYAHAALLAERVAEVLRAKAEESYLSPAE